MFRWTQEAQTWGKSLTEKKNVIFKNQFDLYYAYLLVGLIDGKQRAGKMEDLTDTFPEGYKERSKLIVNLLLVVELKSQGIDAKNKKQVKGLIEKLIEESGNSLKAGAGGGFDACNKYANAGFETMSNLLPKPSGKVDVFVNYYAALLHNKLGGKNIFNE